MRFLLHEDEYLRIELDEVNSEMPTCICCTGVGHGMGAIDLQTREFTKLGNSVGHRIYLIDKTRSWGNAIDFNFVVRVIGPYLKNENYCIGNSMGGFIAVLMTRFLSISKCVSFVPQFSIHSEIVPNECRWRDYIEKINKWKFKSLDGSFVDKTQYFIFSENSLIEKMHWSLFPKLKNIHLNIFNNTDHELAKFLNGKGILYDLIGNCFTGEPFDGLVEDYICDSIN